MSVNNRIEPEEEVGGMKEGGKERGRGRREE
jgi:hypothetical protein